MRFATIFAAAAAVVGATAHEMSVIEVTTCVPTVIYSTITVSATSSVVAPYPTGSASSVWAPTGTGAVYTPSASANATSSAPIASFTGAANAVHGSLAVAGAAAAFAVLMV